MSGQPEEEQSDITQFRLEYKLDATLSINNENWIKPGVSASISWKRLPTTEELQLASGYLIREVVDPLMGDETEQVQKQLLKMKGHA